LNEKASPKRQDHIYNAVK